MDEQVVQMTVLYGSVEMPRPTGRWRQDSDGGWWEDHTPMRWLDQYGNVEREEPYEPYVRIMGGPNPGHLLAAGGYPPSQPWWAFWR